MREKRTEERKDRKIPGCCRKQLQEKEKTRDNPLFDQNPESEAGKKMPDRASGSITTRTGP